MKYLGMEVSFEIIEQEEEDADGESKVSQFLRHERFIDWVPLLADRGIKILLWDQTWSFGFKKREDGKLEVYHRGDRFKGPWPIRLVIFFHQRYVLWACEKFINGKSFGTEDIDKQQEELANIPLHVYREFFAKLHREKEKQIESRSNDPSVNPEELGKEKADLEKLKLLSEQDQSSIAVAKRPMPASFGASNRSVKIIVKDPATQEALESAMKDAKGNRAVNAAVKDLAKNPDLNFYKRSETKSKKKKVVEVTE